MKNHLKTASGNYRDYFTKEQSIYPISDIDCEIIVEVIELFKKLNCKDIVEVLDKWKLSKDVEIRDSLLKFNVDFKSESSNQENENIERENKRIIVKFKHQGYFLDRIFNYGKSDEYIDGKIIYILSLNKIPDTTKTTPLYANTFIEYNDEDARDVAYDRLETLLTNEGIDIVG